MRWSVVLFSVVGNLVYGKELACDGFFAWDSLQWDSLSMKSQKAAAVCGWRKITWDGPPDCNQCFEELSDSKKQSLILMGTDASCWNNYIVNKSPTTKGITSCPASPSAADTGRPANASCMPEGYYNTSWTNFKLWSDMSPEEKHALSVCGWNKEIYSGPDDCMKCFADLTAAQKNAVPGLATLDSETQRKIPKNCWDQNMQTWWGVNCKKSAAERRAVYVSVGMQEKFQVWRKSPGEAFTEPEASWAHSSSNMLLILSIMGIPVPIYALVQLAQRSRGTRASNDSANLLQDTEMNSDACQVESIMDRRMCWPVDVPNVAGYTRVDSNGEDEVDVA